MTNSPRESAAERDEAERQRYARAMRATVEEERAKRQADARRMFSGVPARPAAGENWLPSGNRR